MKKKSLVLALAILALVGCDTKKDDPKENTESNDIAIEEISKDEKKTDGNVEKTTTEPKVENKEIEAPKIESPKKEYAGNGTPIDQVLKDDIYTDVGKLDEDTLLNIYNKPTSRYEKYLSDCAKNGGVEEEYIPNSIRGQIGQGLLMAQQYGIEISSIPVLSAINTITYELEQYLNTIDKTITSDGTVSEFMRIKNFNAFIDPEVANQYSSFRSTLTAQRALAIHNVMNGKEEDPFNKHMICYSGEMDPEDQFYDEFPGDIAAYTFLSLHEDGTAVYITYLADLNDEPKFSTWIDHMRAMPLSAFYTEMDIYGQIKYSEILHLVTGTGFDNL